MGPFNLVLLAVVILGVFAVTGCATQTEAPLVHVCPSLVSYSPDFERAATVQLATLPPDSPIAQMVSDYGALRAAVRICK